MKYRNRSSRETVEGFAFSDFISTAAFEQTRHHEGDLQKSRAMRGYFMSVLLFFLIGILLSRLGFLTLFQGQYYRELSQNNRVRTSVIHAPRGIIFDRNATPLVFNIPGFRQIEKSSLKDSGKLKTTILSNEEATKRLAEGAKDIEIDSLRQYPYADALVHVIGYIGQITEEELGEPQFTPINPDSIGVKSGLIDYRPGDLVGKSGIEQFYEQRLRGVDGKQLVEVDAMGKVIRSLGQQDPVSGKDITVTVDVKLQKAAFLAMKDIAKGAVVVSTPQGEIMAIASKPSFDPNLFTLGKQYTVASDSAYKTIEEVLLDNSGQPLLDRALSGTYPPGSTFKLVTATAGLETKKIDENFTVTDTGVLQVGAFSFGNWYYLQYGGKDGEVDVIKAIKRSNDIFFYHVAQKIGIETLSDTAKRFGLGEKTGIDLYGEAKGLVPSDEWKREVIGEQWYLGDTYHYGIGQGYLLTTPLQVNTFTQAIANVGILYEPHLLKNQKLKVKSQKLLSEKNFSLIRQGMIESCAPGGVAWPLFELKVENGKLKVDDKNFKDVPQSTTSAKFKDYRQVAVACKTGTAQHGGEQTLPHAWITLWAPAYDPQIIVTVLAESSGEGSSIAGPIAKKILEEWFSR